MNDSQISCISDTSLSEKIVSDFGDEELGFFWGKVSEKEMELIEKLQNKCDSDSCHLLNDLTQDQEVNQQNVDQSMALSQNCSQNSIQMNETFELENEGISGQEIVDCSEKWTEKCGPNPVWNDSNPCDLSYMSIDDSLNQSLAENISRSSTEADMDSSSLELLDMTQNSFNTSDRFACNSVTAQMTLECIPEESSDSIVLPKDLSQNSDHMNSTFIIADKTIGAEVTIDCGVGNTEDSNMIQISSNGNECSQISINESMAQSNDNIILKCTEETDIHSYSVRNKTEESVDNKWMKSCVEESLMNRDLSLFNNISEVEENKLIQDFVDPFTPLTNISGFGENNKLIDSFSDPFSLSIDNSKIAENNKQIASFDDTFSPLTNISKINENRNLIERSIESVSPMTYTSQVEGNNKQIQKPVDPFSPLISILENKKNIEPIESCVKRLNPLTAEIRENMNQKSVDLFSPLLNISKAEENCKLIENFVDPFSPLINSYKDEENKAILNSDDPFSPFNMTLMNAEKKNLSLGLIKQTFCTPLKSATIDSISINDSNINVFNADNVGVNFSLNDSTVSQKHISNKKGVKFDDILNNEMSNKKGLPVSEMKKSNSVKKSSIPMFSSGLPQPGFMSKKKLGSDASERIRQRMKPSLLPTAVFKGVQTSRLVCNEKKSTVIPMIAKHIGKSLFQDRQCSESKPNNP